jgi:non-ribosomal peptide synthase protein (TIGR01720 family)
MGIDTRDIFQNPVVAQLALAVKQISTVSEQGLVSGEFALTPIQKWAFATLADKLYWFNQACMFNLETHLDTEQVNKAITQLLTHHDMLRASFIEQDGQFKQKINTDITPNIETQHWQHYDTIAEIPKESTDQWHQQFSLNKNLFKVYLLKLKHHDELLLIANHLIIDTVSWRIVIEDMRSLLIDNHFKLPNKTDDFGRWSAHLHTLAQLNSGQLNESYWKMLIEEQTTFETVKNNLIPSKKTTQRTLGTSENVTFALDSHISDSLIAQVKDTHFTLEQLFLTALGHGLQALTGNTYNLITMENHGRHSISGARSNINISRTLGWFTSYYPMPLSVFDDIGETLQRTKVVKDRLPDNGMAYSLLRWLRQDGEKYNLVPQVSFNYLGEFKSTITDTNTTPFNFNFDVPGRHQHPDIECEHNIDWLMMFDQRKLSITVSYDKDEYTEHDIARLTDGFKQSLMQLNDYITQYLLQRSATGEFTVEGLTDTEFDNLFE